MSKSDDDDRPNLNTGSDWSEMDLFDLTNEIRLNRSIEFLLTIDTQLSIEYHHPEIA